MEILDFEEMNIDPDDPEMPDRDRFVLSKGHTAPGYYSALAHRGFFPVEDLMGLRHIGSHLQGHPCMQHTPGVDMSSGSLGQGISVAVGMALSGKMSKRGYRVYTLLGDGEIEEGQVWETGLLRLQKETSGKIFFRGEDITDCGPGHMGICKNRMQIVYQHSGQAMNPYMTVRSILMEAISAGSEPDLSAEALLEDVELSGSELEKYPSELSGGQQQRVCIARAMAVRPDFVFLDEPLSALDTNTQARIIAFLHRLRDRHHFTALVVSHDPGQISALCDRMCRMRDGKIGEVR